MYGGCGKSLEREAEDPGWVRSLYSDLRGSCWPCEIKASACGDVYQAG